MWEHYKKTRIGMQLFIALASVVIFFVFGRSWAIAAGFFATMQVGAIVGAWWGARLRARLHPQFHS